MTTEQKESPVKPRVTYCPSCHSRYAYDAKKCVACDVDLVDRKPRDFSLFIPKIDVPLVVLAVLFGWFYDRLPGEAQSFGLIFFIIGFATLVTFRAIFYAEWLGRR
jgi:hypothetical protein